MNNELVKEVADVLQVGARYGLKAFARWVLRHELGAVNEVVKELQRARFMELKGMKR